MQRTPPDGMSSGGGRRIQPHLLPALFPKTIVSAISNGRSAIPADRSRSQLFIATAYWRPIYNYLRLRWNRRPDEAEDLTQAFLSKAFERNTFATYDRSRGRFRTFLRVCVDRFVMKHDEAERALKRGGGRRLQFSESLEAVVYDIPDARAEVENALDRGWARSVLALSILQLRDDLEASGKARYYEAFERYDLRNDSCTSYAEVASLMGLSVADVTNYLHVARRELRLIVLATLRQLTANDEEFASEVKAVLGIDVP
jgi:RNA polymerase sigma factor (sigma-70 family)